MIRTWIAAGIVILAASTVVAQSDPIAQRKALMKAQGVATKDVGAMLKGAPFDLAKVQDALKVYVNTTKTFATLFPDNSKTGGETAALPKIWEAKADFDKLLEKFGKDSTAAMTSITDEASFKANMGGVLKNCGDCHELYRAKPAQ